MKKITITSILALLVSCPAFAETTYDAGDTVNCDTSDLSYDTSETFLAGWEPIQYNVVYNVNGASGTAPSNTTCDYDDTCNAASVGNLTKANATFGGWTKSCFAPGGGTCADFTAGPPVNGGDSIADATTTDGATITLTAIWTCMPCNPTHATCQLSESGGVCSYSSSCLTGYENLNTTTPYEPTCSAKTVALTYVDGDGTTPVTPGSGTCEYGEDFYLPAAPTKPGYIFTGWQLKPPFNLSTLFGPNANSICTAGTAFGYQNDGTLPYGYGAYSNNTSTYGIDGDQQWAVSFSYGKIKGEAYCSGKSGNNHSRQWGGDSDDWSATESELTSASGVEKYCWCKTTGFAEPNSSTYENVGESRWVFHDGPEGEDVCAFYCAYNCARDVYLEADFRAAVFGVTGADMCD